MTLRMVRKLVARKVSDASSRLLSSWLIAATQLGFITGTLEGATDISFDAMVEQTKNVAQAVRDAGIAEGMALVCAMHITAAVWINDDEPGLQADTLEWLDKVAPPSWREPANDVARELLAQEAWT